MDKNNNTGYSQVVVETDAAGAVKVSYTYGDDLISQTRAEGAFIFHYDGVGSTRALTDAAATATDTYTYDAFGNLIAKSGETPNDYLFTGEQYDPNLGFYYLRARYYNPNLGRFLTADLWPGDAYDPPTLHKYLYARLDPANMIDPSGRLGAGTGTLTETMSATFIMAVLATLMLPVVLLAQQQALRALSGPITISITLPLFMQATSGREEEIAREIKDIIKEAVERAGEALRYGDCTPSQAGRLQAVVILACKDYFGQKGCEGLTDVEAVMYQKAWATACASAREAINLICFRGGDPGYRTKAASAWEAVAHCAKVLRILKAMGG